MKCTYTCPPPPLQGCEMSWQLPAPGDIQLAYLLGYLQNMFDDGLCHVKSLFDSLGILLRHLVASCPP
eukprot:2459240-Heterocapsa_arctica.AAC.1